MQIQMTTTDITIPSIPAMDAVRAQIAVWVRRSRTRRHFRDLDPDLLDDIGYTEEQRSRECGKWFWQP